MDLYKLIVFPLSGLAASSVNSPTIATPGKHNHGVCPSVTRYVMLAV